MSTFSFLDCFFVSERRRYNPLAVIAFPFFFFLFWLFFFLGTGGFPSPFGYFFFLFFFPFFIFLFLFFSSELISSCTKSSAALASLTHNNGKIVRGGYLHMHCLYVNLVTRRQ